MKNFHDKQLSRLMPRLTNSPYVAGTAWGIGITAPLTWLGVAHGPADILTLFAIATLLTGGVYAYFSPTGEDR